MNTEQMVPYFLIIGVAFAPFLLMGLLYLLQRKFVHHATTAVETRTQVTKNGVPVGVCSITGALTDGNLDIVLSHIQRGTADHKNVILDFRRVEYIDEPEETLRWLQDLQSSQRIVISAPPEIRVLLELLDLSSKYAIEREVHKALVHFDDDPHSEQEDHG
ncbi:MAG: hypothetical protein P1V97_23270 [Planctomycetota bacterium]|nr:hypothetical protein [Planctomycetota bacterium]